jgi:hypothetical protein
MLIPFGILSASAVGSDYELIESRILTSTASSVVFSGLATYAGVYKHLQIRCLAKTTDTVPGFYSTAIRFNGDTAANYSNHLLRGNGSSVASSAGASVTRMVISDASIGSEPFAMGVADILDAYSTTKNKTLRSFAGMVKSDFKFVELWSGSWRNTAALTSITLFHDGTNMATGSRFSLYGIKG